MVRRTLLGASLALTLAAGACGRLDEADEYREAVPRHEDISIVVPGGDGAQTGALTAEPIGATRGALLGQQAELYRLTRGVTAVVNGGTVAVLALVRTITAFPPSQLEDDVAVWGPHTQPLSPNTWRLTVTRLAPGRFQYLFEAKPKTAPDSGYLTILSGHHEFAGGSGVRRRAGRTGYGSGDFDIDWDNAQMLPEHDDNVGSAHFVYSRPAAGEDATIAVTFRQVMDEDTGMRVDAQYAFVDTPADGGSFQFTLTKNELPATAALETLSVRSRWRQSGAGRSDVKMVGGDLGAAQATASECWDSNFASVYMTNSYGDAAKMWGAEASCDAAFPAPDYAVF